MSERPSRFDFGDSAASYDEWYGTSLGRTYDLYEKRAIERVLPDPATGNRLLDIGCGTGHWSAFFSRSGFVVNGVDVSPEMIEIARRRRIHNASFEVADAHALPLEDGRFDVTVAITALEFVRNAEVVVREMARCTRRPGGVLLVGVLNALAAVNVGRKADARPPYVDARFFSPEELKALLVPFGKTRVAATTFVPRSAWAVPLAPLTDLLGRVFGTPHGAFVVKQVLL